MKSIISERKKAGMIIVSVENKYLGAFSREFVGADLREDAKKHAEWLEKLAEKKKKAKS